MGEALEDAVFTFNEAKAGVCTKTYDYLDHRNPEFNVDFEIFMEKTNELKESIGALIEENFASVWETPQGIKFLTRFEKVSEKIPLTKMDEKYDRVLKYCEREIDRMMKLFRREKENPPLPRHFPPIAGRIKWARSLHAHLEDLAKSVSGHPVLRVLPQTSELMRKYNSVSAVLKAYEEDLKNTWMSHDVWVLDECLHKNLLAIDNDNRRLKVNMDFRVKLLIREADCLIKMNIPIPHVTLTLLAKRDYFTLVSDSLQVRKLRIFF